MVLCECGCGQEVKRGSRFVRGHNRRGIPHTDDTKQKTSNSLQGEKCYMFGRKHSRRVKSKMSESHKGRTHTDETKRHMSYVMNGKNSGKTHTGDTKKKISEALSGEKSYLWRGGISFDPYCSKFNNQVKEAVREQYGRACFLCGVLENSRKLDVHHVDYNKEQGCEDHNWKLVPLCRSCHAKTNHNREYYENLILEKLEELN